MKRNELACERARELLEFELDGELAEVERNALRGHLRDCEACRAWQASLRSEFALIASLPQVSEPQGFTEQVMNRLPARWAPALAWRRALGYAIACAAVVCAIWLTARPGNQQVVRRQSPHKSPIIVKDRPAPANERTAVVTPEVPPVAQSDMQPTIVRQPVTRVATAPMLARRARVAPVRRVSGTARLARVVEPPTNYVQLGEDYEREGMLDEALAAYQRADAQSPSLSTSLAVARVHDKLGQTEEAMETYVDAAFADWSEEPSTGNTEG